MLYALFYSRVHGLLDLLKRKDRWAIYSRIRLFRLGSLFEEVHYLLELVLGTLVGCIPLPVQGDEEGIIFLGHVIRASATILDRRREADVRRWLREDRGIERVISDITENGFGGGDMRLVYFPLGSCIDCSLQMEFLSKRH